MRKSLQKFALGAAIAVSTTFTPVHADSHMADYEMSMHHMHMMINHALEMATEGSNMVMLAQMKMADGVDEISLAHGQMMIQHAKELLKDVMEGEAMRALHKKGHSPEAGALMVYTHHLGDSAANHIKLLEKMSSSPAHSGHKH